MHHYHTSDDISYVLNLAAVIDDITQKCPIHGYGFSYPYQCLCMISLQDAAQLLSENLLDPQSEATRLLWDGELAK